MTKLVLDWKHQLSEQLQTSIKLIHGQHQSSGNVY